MYTAPRRRGLVARLRAPITALLVALAVIASIFLPDNRLPTGLVWAKAATTEGLLWLADSRASQKAVALLGDHVQAASALGSDEILRSPGMPADFRSAKALLEEYVHFDYRVDQYCGCRYDSKKQLAPGCPLRTSVYENRADRIEYEHVVPASDFGRQRACWRSPPPDQSGREHCREVDEQFRLMEADPHNLIPVIGTLNALRSNYRFGMVASESEESRISGCPYKIASDGAGRFIEPPDAVKGKIARIYLYMEDRYEFKIGRSQRRVIEAWHRQFPVSQWEIARNRRLFRVTGVENPYVGAATAASEPAKLR